MASEDDLVEISPCPNCRSPLTVSVADLGHLVECPSCSTQFRARRPGTEPAPERPRSRESELDSSEEPRRSRPGSREESEDDRPRSTPRRRRRPDDDEYEDDRDDVGERDRDRVRSRGRRRYRDAYDDYPRRAPGQGATTALGVIHLVMSGLVLFCGCANIGLSLIARDLLKQNGGPPAGLKARPGQIEREIKILMIAGTLYILSSGLYLAAGLTVLNRARSGRGLTVAAVIFAVLAILYQVITAVIAAKNGDLDDSEPGEIVGAIIGLMIWISYIVTSLILLSKSGRQLR